MNDKTYERLSALVDDVLDGHELDKTLADVSKNQDSARDTWERYQLIQDIMHKQYAMSAGDLADRVSLAIDAEPHILAPKHYRWLSHTWAKVAVGGSLAASVALASVLGLRVALVDKNDSPATLAEHNQTIKEAIKHVMPTNAQEVAPKVLYPSKESRLNGYIVNHNEYSSSVNVHGMLPYMRVIGHESSVNNNEFKQK
jgi:sigma-E factor negative regulatory protein RseA